MKRLFKVLIMFVFIFSFFSFNSLTTEAATTKIAHVNIKSGTLNVRSGAGTKYKKVGSLKKDAGVYVYSKTKSGWSEIRYKKKKAYVATKYLKFADSYLMDKTKIYTYIEYKEKFKYVYSGKSDDRWDKWVVDGEYGYFVDENINGLFTKLELDSEYIYSEDIRYPVKVGKTWYRYEERGKLILLLLLKP